MTFLAAPQSYTAETFADFVATLQWKEWHPKFVTLHNTGVPTLTEWMDPDISEIRRAQGQIDYERDTEHWHSGVHLFITPDEIINICDLTADGVSVSCWNSLCIGVEMVGNYALPTELGPKDPPADDWSSPQSQAVRDNTVAALAVLHRALGLRPDGLVRGKNGLHLHRYCTQDHHACPGGQVDWADIVRRTLAKMEQLRTGAVT